MRLSRWRARRVQAASRLLIPLLSVLALAGLVKFHWPALVGPGHAEERGPHTASPNLLALADAVCPELIHAHRPVLVSDAAFELLLDWRIRERRVDHRPLQTPSRDLLPSASHEQFKAWLRQSSCDLLLLIDAPNSSEDDVKHLRALLAASGDYTLDSQWDLPESKAAAQVWRARPGHSEHAQVLSTQAP